MSSQLINRNLFYPVAAVFWFCSVAELIWRTRFEGLTWLWFCACQTFPQHLKSFTRTEAFAGHRRRVKISARGHFKAPWLEWRIWWDGWMLLSCFIPRSLSARSQGIWWTELAGWHSRKWLWPSLRVYFDLPEAKLFHSVFVFVTIVFSLALIFSPSLSSCHTFSE